MNRQSVMDQARGSGWSVLVRGLRAAPHLTQGIVVTLLFGALGAFGRVVIPMAIQVATDEGINRPGGVDVQIVTASACLAGGAAISSTFGTCLMNRRLVRRSEESLRTLRSKAFRHVHSLPPLQVQAEQRGALVSRVTTDIDAVAHFLQDMGLAAIVSLMQMLFAIGVICTYSWKLAGLVLVGFVPLFVLVRSMQQLTKRRFDAVRKSFGAMTSVLAEALMGAGVIRGFGVQRPFGERIDGAVEELRQRQWEGQLTTTRTLVAGELVPGLTTAGVIAVGVVLGTHDRITVGELLSTLFLIPLFVAPMQLGVEIINQTQEAIAGLRRVLGLLETPQDTTVPDDARRPAPLKAGALAFSDVTFRYPDGSAALQNVSVTIPSASKVAVVGHTGSGKSTFGMLSARLADPTSGTVTLDGEPLGSIPRQALRRRVALVPQESFLFNTTVADNVRCGRPHATDEEIGTAFAELGLTDWLGTLSDGLATEVGERGGVLSAGERQLVALVRAHIGHPDVLVLDEATSSVDPVTEERVHLAMERLVSGRTSIHIVHRLSSAEDADEVLVLRAGRIVERGSHEALVARRGAYRALHDAWLANTAH